MESITIEELREENEDLIEQLQSLSRYIQILEDKNARLMKIYELVRLP